jgi:hypothetical protein
MRRLLAFALLLSGVPARAGTATSSPPEAQQLIDRWSAAVNGSARGRAPRSVYVRAEATEDAISGPVEEWLEGDAWRRLTTQAGRTSEEVCLGGAAWVKDWNGKVLELQGRDRLDQLTEASIAALVFGGAIQRLAANVVVQLTGEDETHASQVLRFSPRDGIPFDVFLDKTTSLPLKIVRKPENETITLVYSEWRAIQGRKIPFGVRRTSGEEGDGATVAVRELTSSGRAARASIARPVSSPADYRFASGRSALGIPFNFENDHLMVRARVNGSDPLWFMLDTGAEATIINKARMTQLGVQPFGSSSINGGGNSADFAFADVARLEVGGATLLDQRDGVLDLSGLERIYGMPMGGLFGYDFFSRFVVRVDYDAKTIDLLEPGDYRYSGSGSPVPFVLRGRCPHLTSTITVPSLPPLSADLIIDAGAADTVNLTSPFVRANRLLEFARKSPAGGPNTMAGSEKEFFAQTSVRGRLGTISLGSFTLKDIPSNLMVGSKGAYASESFSGVVGEGILHRFNAVYDYARNVMILEPNGEFEKPFPGRKTFGATLLSDGADYTTFKVTGVRKDSPAEAAGLKKDDVIVSADGKAAAELRLADLRKLFADEGAHHVLAVTRDGQPVTIEFTVTLVSLDES